MLFVDTSAIIAQLDRDDQEHRNASEHWSLMKRKRWTPLITNFIIDETYTHLMNRCGGSAAREWLRSINLPCERVTDEDERAAKRILFAFEDKSFSYTDATSFAVMERLGIKIAFSFDHDFCQYGGLTVLGCTHA